MLNLKKPEEKSSKKQPELGLTESLFTSYKFDGVTDGDPDLLHGVVVCEEGEAKGHGFYLSSKFLDQVVSICTGAKIKVRVDHPEKGKGGKLLSIVGEAFNFRREGNKVRADIKLFDVPSKGIILSLAREASDLFGMSLDFLGKAGKKLENGLREMFCQAVNAVDFVESPAATTSLFEKLVDSPEDTNTENKFSTMNIAISEKMLAALGLGENADEKSIVAALEGVMVKASRYDEGEKEKEDDGKKEKMSDDEGDKKEDKKEEMSAKFSKEDIKAEVQRLAAQEVTALLAKVGSDPKFSFPKKEEEKKEEKKEGRQLSAEEKAIAKQLGIKEEDFLVQLQKQTGLQTFQL